MSLGARHEILHVLIVEDKDDKYREVCAALTEYLATEIEIVRASTITEGEDRLEDRAWSLVVLDISMDISGASTGPIRGGHANLGGLDIIERMFLLGIDLPTVVVTGFDYFQSVGAREEAEFIDLDELNRRVQRHLGANYLGCLRYGVDGWQSQFVSALKRWRK